MAPLYEEPFMVAVPRTHHLASRDKVSAEELKKETMLLLALGIASAIMCWRCALSTPVFLATPKASAKALKALRWKPSSTWWPPAWA